MAVLSFLLSLCLQSCTEPQQSVHTDLTKKIQRLNGAAFTPFFYCVVLSRGERLQRGGADWLERLRS